MATKVEAAQERLALCHLVIGIMRCLHEHYLPTGEPFGTRMECMHLAIALLLGQIEGKPFSASKAAAYMNMPRTTVLHRLARLQQWGILDREGNQYSLKQDALNSLMGMKSYQQVRRLLKKANEELLKLDT